MVEIESCFLQLSISTIDSNCIRCNTMISIHSNNTPRTYMAQGTLDTYSFIDYLYYFVIHVYMSTIKNNYNYMI